MKDTVSTDLWPSLTKVLEADYADHPIRKGDIFKFPHLYAFNKMLYVFLSMYKYLLDRWSGKKRELPNFPLAGKSENWRP